jgi:hypothetical protein
LHKLFLHMKYFSINYAENMITYCQFIWMHKHLNIFDWINP